MSYCRWSSDDWRSDVYVYESQDGFVTNVAESSVVLAEELPEPIRLQPGFTHEQFHVWWKRQQAVADIVERSPTVKIGGLYDGATFVDPDPGACATTLRMLAIAGYRIPAGVVERLESEAAE